MLPPPLGEYALRLEGGGRVRRVYLRGKEWRA
jgi:hypothetical protein